MRENSGSRLRESEPGDWIAGLSEKLAILCTNDKNNTNYFFLQMRKERVEGGCDLTGGEQGLGGSIFPLFPASPGEAGWA